MAETPVAEEQPVEEPAPPRGYYFAFDVKFESWQAIEAQEVFLLRASPPQPFPRGPGA